MSHEYLKEARASHERKLKAYGKEDKNDGKAKNWAGFDALNTSEQRGLKPLDKEPELSKETMPRIMRKSGGRIHGADSLKRLDRPARKGKAMGGARVGQVPTPQEQEQRFSCGGKTSTTEHMKHVARRAKGGKVSEMEWEHSKKDLAEDRKLARKHHMPLEKWEESKLDEKHDKQQSMEGLKRGGRAHRAEGGALQGGKKKNAGKTTVNVIIGAPKAVDYASPQSSQQPPQQAAPPPPPPPGPPQGGPPPGGPPMMGPPGMPPGMPPMPRKDGGAVKYKKPGRKDGYPAMDFGSGSGFGRKQKIDAYGEPPIKSRDNY